MSAAWILAVYVVGLYPAYRLFLWLNITDFGSRKDGICKKTDHRTAITQAACWPWAAGLAVIVFGALAPLVLFTDWLEARPFSKRIDAWLKDETPCK